MWKWWRIGVAASLCGLLGACGGGGGTDDRSPIPARAGEAQIGTTGGMVDAVLEGGTTLRIDIPADALKANATLRIEPVPAQPGDLGGFRITPADLALAKPVTLTLTWSTQQDPPADVALAVRRYDALLQFSPVLRGQELRFEVNNLGALPPGLAEVSNATQALRAKAHAASGRPRALATPEPTEETLRLVAMAEAQRLAVLRNAVDLARNGQGTSQFALDVQHAFDVVSQSIDPASPELRSIALDWRAFVCDQRGSADNALGAYQNSSVVGNRVVVFERLAAASLRWGLVARDMTLTLAGLQPAIGGCDGAPADFRQPVLDKLPDFLARVEADFEDDPSSFDELLDETLPPLMRIEVMLQLVDANGLVLPTMRRLAVELRDLPCLLVREGYGFGGDLHLKLLTRTIEDAAFIAIAPYTAHDIREDIQRCATLFNVTSVDSAGQTVEEFNDLGSNDRERVVNMTGVATLRIDGGYATYTLACPNQVHNNNEGLIVEAGPTPQSMTRLADALIPQDDAYFLDTRSVDLSYDRLYALRQEGTNETILQIRRAGELCFDLFPGLTENFVLVRLRLVFGGETFVGTVTMSYEQSIETSYVSPPFPLFEEVQGSPTGKNLRDTADETSLNGTWNVAVDMIAGRTVAVRVLSASGTASRNSRDLRVNERRGSFGCKRTETIRHAFQGGGIASLESSSGTLRLESDDSYELWFRGVFLGTVLATSESRYSEEPVYDFCRPQRSDDGPASGLFEFTAFLEDVKIPPMQGTRNNGVLSGSVTRNFPVPSTLFGGSIAAGSEVLTMTWDLRRQ